MIKSKIFPPFFSRIFDSYIFLHVFILYYNASDAKGGRNFFPSIPFAFKNYVTSNKMFFSQKNQLSRESFFDSRGIYLRIYINNMTSKIKQKTKQIFFSQTFPLETFFIVFTEIISPLLILLDDKFYALGLMDEILQCQVRKNLCSYCTDLKLMHFLKAFI